MFLITGPLRVPVWGAGAQVGSFGRGTTRSQGWELRCGAGLAGML